LNGRKSKKEVHGSLRLASQNEGMELRAAAKAVSAMASRRGVRQRKRFSLFNVQSTALFLLEEEYIRECCCSLSFAKLMQNCSKSFSLKLSNP
ncbi:MAG: hypothetical protein MI674_00755, partial [Cytophagales bacterium]|nr:hypothetical protein [Cytophagales bacterium]